jgi:hypothetical protein
MTHDAKEKYEMACCLGSLLVNSALLAVRRHDATFATSLTRRHLGSRDELICFQRLHLARLHSP